MVAVSANCTSKVHVVEEINEGSAYEMHVVNRMLRESAKESFAGEDCSREVAVNEFGQQTQEVVVSDVVVVDNVVAVSGVVEKNCNDGVVMGGCYNNRNGAKN